MNQRGSAKVSLPQGIDTAILFGRFDANLKIMEEALGVRITGRGDDLAIEGSPKSVERAEKILADLSNWVVEGRYLRPDDVRRTIRAVVEDQDALLMGMVSGSIVVSPGKRAVVPKSPNQKAYVEAIRAHDLVIAVGPAGTGKTYLAMAMAVSALLKKEVDRIILARPAVEAGEKLGFLPGDMMAKIHPYLRPLYDALYDMMEVDRANRLVERGDIEIAPLAFMRGRTLNDSFVILDEAQNATAEQMKMFLTRLGFHSKAAITGDITQIDLAPEKVSGLIEVREILSGIEGIAFITFDERDVVRHRLVQEIIKAYERYHGKSSKKRRR